MEMVTLIMTEDPVIMPSTIVLTFNIIGRSQWIARMWNGDCVALWARVLTPQSTFCTVAPSPHHHSGSRCPGPRCSKAVYDMMVLHLLYVLQYRHIFIENSRASRRVCALFLCSFNNVVAALKERKNNALLSMQAHFY